MFCFMVAIYVFHSTSSVNRVQDDIVATLQMSEELVRVVHPFNRPNLFYEVRDKAHIFLTLS